MLFPFHCTQVTINFFYYIFKKVKKRTARKAKEDRNKGRSVPKVSLFYLRPFALLPLNDDPRIRSLAYFDSEAKRESHYLIFIIFLAQSAN